MLDHERPIGPGTVFDRCAPDSRRSAGTSAMAPECHERSAIFKIMREHSRDVEKDAGKCLIFVER